MHGSQDFKATFNQHSNPKSNQLKPFLAIDRKLFPGGQNGAQ